MPEQVILVDKNDTEIGQAGKIDAHRKALLHRAFSIFIFNKKGELLLQRRALSKYHTPGLWTNTCCSHPRPGEETIDAAHRRLQEEMGFDCELKEVHVFRYRAEFHDLTEYEVDHVLVGQYEGNVDFNPQEVAEYKWMRLEELKIDIEKNPHKYTPWFKIILKEYFQ